MESVVYFVMLELGHLMVFSLDYQSLLRTIRAPKSFAAVMDFSVKGVIFAWMNKAGLDVK